MPEGTDELSVKISDFGRIDSAFFAHAADENIRIQASSGGFIKSFLVYLLDSGNADLAIVTRTGSSANPIVPETAITNSRDDILSTRTNSVYAVHSPLPVMRSLDPGKRYVLVGLPCQIKSLKSMQNKGQYSNVTFVIGLFCHHTPDIRFTNGILKKLGVKKEEVDQIEYRGNGWPGGFTAHLKNGQRRFIATGDYWSNNLNNGPKMCRRCSEIGQDADVFVGDPWNLGFEADDNKGTSLVICRNRRARELVEAAAEGNHIRLKHCSMEQLLQSQGYHIEEKLRRNSPQRGTGRAARVFNFIIKLIKILLDPPRTLLISRNVLRMAINKMSIPTLAHKAKNLLQFPPVFAQEEKGLVRLLRNPGDSTRVHAICRSRLARKPLIQAFANRILVWYWREDKSLINFGDYITVLILKAFGYRVVSYSDAIHLNILNRYGFCLLIIGSELNKEMVDALQVPEIYVWGQGKGHGEFFDIRKKSYAGKVKIFAVRGPHTIRQLGLSRQTPVGDPGFLMPLFYKVKKDRLLQNIAYVPHHSNRDDWDRKMRQVGAERYVDVMCTRSGFPVTLKQIVSSEFVLTSTLHTAIVCHAYGVPWALCLAEGDELNYPDKWKDLFEFLGIHEQDNAVSNYKDGLRWWGNVGSKAKPVDVLPLLNSFPLPVKKRKALEIIREVKSGRM